MSTQHAKLTANNLKDAASFILEQAGMIECLEREQRARSRLVDALVDIATTSTDQSSRDKAKAALRPGIAMTFAVPEPLTPYDEAANYREAALLGDNGGLCATKSNTPVAYDQ